jgi:class 3 adenylate cyclase
MAASSAYIPFDRQRAIAEGTSLPTRTYGSALFADISGFTQLAEALTRTFGQARGAEELVETLDRVYDALLGEVHRFGGSVIGFSGDGVTCWFEGHENRRAVAAASAMQSAMQQFRTMVVPQGGTVAFSVKVAVATGPIRRFLIGDPTIQLLDTLAGSTIDRLAMAGSLTGKDEVVIDEPTFKALAGLAQVKEWRTRDSLRFAVIFGLNAEVQQIPVTPLDPNLLSDEQIRPWLLEPVYHRLQSGQGDFLAELRYTLSVFISFGGIDYDQDDSAGDKLNAFVFWVQKVLERYEGALLDVTIGDKGSYLYSVFGAPIAHDDDAIRALRAALDLRELPSELRQITPIKIGISQGRMRTGAYGSKQRHTYGVLGNEVNLAARLMELAAPWQILVTERVVNAGSAHYQFTPMGAILIKGKQDTVNVFQLQGRDSTRTQKPTSATMVGRLAERTLLSGKLDALLIDKASHVIIIEGEAGIGKTRLLEQARNEAQDKAVMPLSGTGNAIEKSTPYYAWRPIFSHIFKLDTLPDDKSVRSAHVLSRLDDTLPSHLKQLTPLIKAVIPLDFPENELTEQMTGQVRADNIQLLLLQILQNLASAGPIFLLLEDAQWFDSASWSLTRRAVTEIGPILMVMATRPLSEPLPIEYRTLLAEASTTHIVLKPMPLDEVHAMVAQRLGVQSVPDSIAKLISERAEGNPFYAEELAYAMRDAGLIQIIGGQLQLAPNLDLHALTLPESVQDLVTSRIDRLSPAQQLTIKVASVIGRIFIYRILHDSYPINQERTTLREQLETLGRLDLTALETLEPEITYAFKHFITQEVSYSLMLFSQRRELHRAIAEWYEKYQADDLSAYYALLAHHWSNAEQPAKAIEYLEEAGEQALRNFANTEAAAFFERALTLADQGSTQVDPLRRARWELQAGEAYVNMSDYVNGRRYIEAGLARVGQPVPSKTSGQITSVLGQIIRQFMHRKMPSRYIGQSPENKDNLLVLARAYERLSEATYFLGETLVPVYSAFRGLNLAEGAGASPETARSSAAVGALLGFIPLHDIARGYLDRAQSMAYEFDNLESREFVSMTSSYYYCGVGDWTKVQEQVGQVLALADLLGDKRRWQDVISHITSMRYFQGEFASSAELANELHQIASHRQDSRFMALAIQDIAHHALYSGRLDDATQYLSTLQALIGEGSEVSIIPLKMELLGLTSLVHLQRGEDNEALKAAQQSLDLTVKANPSFYAAVTGYTAPAEVYLTLWENQPANTEFAQQSRLAVQTLGKYARVFPIGQPRLLRYQGWLHSLSGKKDQAHRKWQTGLHRAEQLGMLYDQGILHYEIARHLSAADPAHSNHISQAMNLFTRLNATYDLERTQKL